MKNNNRNYFDKQVDWVLDRLPQHVLRLLEEVPLHVEDQPSERLMEELNITDTEDLCGYFCGTPFSEGTPYVQSVTLPNSVTIFRRGIVAEARDEEGKVSRSSLRRQIRITILHELAHLHGMDEEEIAEAGYA